MLTLLPLYENATSFSKPIAWIVGLLLMLEIMMVSTESSGAAVSVFCEYKYSRSHSFACAEAGTCCGRQTSNDFLVDLFKSY